MISDPDSVYGWADLCRDFDSQFFDLDRRSISLGTHDIKMYGVEREDLQNLMQNWVTARPWRYTENLNKQLELLPKRQN